MPLRSRALGALALVWGFLMLALLQASRTRFALGVPLGLLAALVAACGALKLLGCLEPNSEQADVDLRRCARPFAACLVAALGLVLALRAAVAGILPFPRSSSAVLVTAGCWALLSSGYWLLRTSGVFRSNRSVWSREGFWLLTLGIVLYVPVLGSFSLIDPWETHYGEVAREMLSRSDWISLWWAQDGWFWSKPALDFWLQGLSFLLLGVRTEPDQMLAAAADGHFPAPEWAVRFPGIALTLITSYVAYLALRTRVSRRAGFLAGLALLTTPYWFFLARQSMTDMPYVAPLTAALALFLLGFAAAPEQSARSFNIAVGARSYRLSAQHLVLGFVLLSSLPQLSYLVSRHFTPTRTDATFGWHLDRFASGSPGNCGLPGNEACATLEPVNAVFQPAVAALVWAAALGGLLFLNRHEQRSARLFYLAAWYCTALSVLAKGAPGLLLAVLIPVAVLCLRQRFQDLARLELVSGLLLLCAVALPWYVQALMRHGPAFTDRLLFYDMYKRAFVHVHDTNAGDDVSFRYYLWQLGYGLFPWSSWCFIGFLDAFSSESAADRKKSELSVFLSVWFVLSFALFSVSLTKYHHYILPAVPPLALLSGLTLDRLWGAPTKVGDVRQRLALSVGYALVAGATTLAILNLIAGNIWGTPSQAAASLLQNLQGVFLLLLALGAALFVLRSQPPDSDGSWQESSVHGLLCVGAAAALVLIGRELVFDDGKEGALRLVQLFSYNYSRPWPKDIDFRPVLAALTGTAAVLLALGIVPRLRRLALGSLVAQALLFTLFLNVYLLRIAPHWGQRETVLQYYLTRAGPEEPLVAYQLNWKGENFYTGNRLPTFVQSGQAFREWLDEQKNSGTRVVYFTTEHVRQNVLKNELGLVKRFQVLTKPSLNNKFFLARVEL